MHDAYLRGSEAWRAETAPWREEVITWRDRTDDRFARIEGYIVEILHRLDEINGGRRRGSTATVRGYRVKWREHGKPRPRSFHSVHVIEAIVGRRYDGLDALIEAARADLMFRQTFASQSAR